MRRMFRKWGNVCQNCVFGNNKKGKWIKKRFRNPHPKGYWHIFCEKKQKYFTWDNFKLCFKDKLNRKEELTKIVKRLIELSKEYHRNSQKNSTPIKDFLEGKSKGIDKALEVIDGLTNYDPEIHKLIDDFRSE